MHQPLEPTGDGSLCAPVGFVCFREPRPVAHWKRPALSLCSLATILLGVVMAMVVWAEFAERFHISRPHRALGHAVLDFSPFAAGIAGLIVAAFGCDRCIARLTVEL